MTPWFCRSSTASFTCSSWDCPSVPWPLSSMGCSRAWEKWDTSGTCCWPPPSWALSQASTWACTWDGASMPFGWPWRSGCWCAVGPCCGNLNESTAPWPKTCNLVRSGTPGVSPISLNQIQAQEPMPTDRTNGSLYVKVEQGVAQVEFGHPAGNSFVLELLDRLAGEFDKLATQEDVSLIVLRSEGDRAFCAGASLQELLEVTNLEQGKRFFGGFAQVINAMRKCPKPIKIGRASCRERGQRRVGGWGRQRMRMT